jgi:hypothetical protein
MNNKNEQPTKFERVYEDEETISIWRYDLKKFRNGPVEVEYKYKKGFKPKQPGGKKFIKDMIKEKKKPN